MSGLQTGDARLLARVRWHLIAWSGGIVLVVLVALGIVLTIAVARSLEATGTAQLAERATTLTRIIHNDPDGGAGPGRPPVGMAFGGPSSGTFAFVVPPILRGTGICLPSASECQSIDLQVGHVEELEYVEADGQVVVYELKIVSIVKKSAGASAARAKHGVKPAQARFKAMAGQSIGQASEIEVSPAAGSAQSTRR